MQYERELEKTRKSFHKLRRENNYHRSGRVIGKPIKQSKSNLPLIRRSNDLKKSKFNSRLKECPKGCGRQ